MKPSYSQCSSCEATLNQVEIPNRARQHVIERHYRTFNEGIDPERSLFIENAISPRSLFNTVIMKLRTGMQASRKQGHRYIYHVSLDYPVGVFPNRQGGFYETNTIKIVCNYNMCQQCSRHWPSTVVTIYPCMKPFIWTRSTVKKISWFLVLWLRGSQANHRVRLTFLKTQTSRMKTLLLWLKIPAHCSLAKCWLLHNGLQLLVTDLSVIDYWPCCSGWQTKLFLQFINIIITSKLK